MRSRMLLGLVQMGGIVAAVALVGPADAARQPAVGNVKSVEVQVPMPPPNTSGITVATVTAKAAEGEKVGRIHVKTTNDADLQTINPSAVYVIKQPRERSRREAITVYALIRRFSNKAPENTLDFSVSIKTELLGTHPLKPLTNCTQLKNLDDLFESGATEVSGPGGADPAKYILKSARPPSEQGTAPEEILDEVVAGVWTELLDCPGQPEGDDDGPT